MPPGHGELGFIERLNMVHQIPEIGVVAVGNQAGRVALLTMTRWQSCKQPGFKIEVILPYKSQEIQGLRPEVPLMGIAISPVQGQQTRDKSHLRESNANFAFKRGTRALRRYRLLIIYRDHTILSYEISRPTIDGEVLII